MANLHESAGVTRVLVVGGGTAGWITACVLAADHGRHGLEVTLVEAPNIPTIGVGEGTWPSLRQTLARIGVGEDEFLVTCGASFKQGTQFSGWSNGEPETTYLHPFSLPVEYTDINPAKAWLTHGAGQSFAHFTTAQSLVVAHGLAPKTLDMPDYAFAVNYGYHFDAGKLVDCLRIHGTQKLGIKLKSAEVTRVRVSEQGGVERLEIGEQGSLSADLYVDCTGQKGLIINELDRHELVSLHTSLFNDAAVVVQVPYSEKAGEDAEIASTTLAVAQSDGWIWDIGLQHRRGLGYVFSKSHTTEGRAQQALEQYIQTQSQFVDCDMHSLDFRTLNFEPGHRRQFWVKNCVAVGLSAGFVEPLEASAIALIEQSAGSISQDLPTNPGVMEIVAKRFNAMMAYHWGKIAEFLKLHYAISQRRDSAYWRDHSRKETWPESLCEKLLLWQQQPPFHDDAPLLKELFPSASYQFVLYGMGFLPEQTRPLDKYTLKRLDAALHRMATQRDHFARNLPTNQTLLAEIAARSGRVSQDTHV